MEQDQIAYIFDLELLKECDRLPMVKSRASIVHDLITAYDLLSNNGNVRIIPSVPATDEKLGYFHSSDYIKFLKDHNDKNEDELENFTQNEFEELESYGLIDDCYLLERNYDLVKAIAGSSLTAAELLLQNKIPKIMNWFGGWHHAQRDKANGFCYVNDIVLAIQHLSKEFKRILYIDLDAHHGDGVQNAFEFSKNILTLSLHRYSQGFYPNSGALNEIGKSNGKYFSINIPLKGFISSENYEYIFKSVFKIIFESFSPHVMVIQCGADIISGDKYGECNVSIESMLTCVREILATNIPSLFLGGGGYNFANTARYWTSLTALILNKSISKDIPDSSTFFTDYTPSYELTVSRNVIADNNSVDYLNEIIKVVQNYGCMIRNVIYENK